jgi:hypothetical protein
MKAPPVLTFCVKLRTLFLELAGFFFHSFLQRSFVRDSLLYSIFSHVFRYFHRAEVRAAHGAEVRGLGAFLRQRFVVEFARGDGVEVEVELNFPAEFTARCSTRCRGFARRDGLWRGSERPKNDSRNRRNRKRLFVKAPLH